MELRVKVRRFRCAAVLCGRQLFAERFGDRALAPMARRTGRLDDIVHHLGLALGGRPAAAFAARLMAPVSNDTLLRVVRRRARLPTNPLSVIGIDDFACRRNHRYGTIVCDLERRQPVVLLPDPEQATAEAWLALHPYVVVVARDRGGGYGGRSQRLSPTRSRSQIAGIASVSRRGVKVHAPDTQRHRRADRRSSTAHLGRAYPI